MKRIKMLRVLLSQEEYEDLLRRAGDVPISRYVRRVLSGAAEPLIVDRAVDGFVAATAGTVGDPIEPGKEYEVTPLVLQREYVSYPKKEKKVKDKPSKALRAARAAAPPLCRHGLRNHAGCK